MENELEAPLPHPPQSGKAFLLPWQIKGFLKEYSDEQMKNEGRFQPAPPNAEALFLWPWQKDELTMIKSKFQQTEQLEKSFENNNRKIDPDAPRPSPVKREFFK